jgi:flagellar assembly protein FliH
MEKQAEKITPYRFKTFGDEEKLHNLFEFKKLEKGKFKRNVEKILFQEELTKKGELEMFPFIKEQNERKEVISKINEEKFQQEVNNRLKKIEKEYIDKAYEEGLKIAREEVKKEFEIEFSKKIESLNEMLKSALDLRDEIFENQKGQIIFLIKSLTKWVIMRELTDDGKYLEKLLEKLLTEIQAKQNFIIQVSQKDFEKMPEIIKIIEQKMGEFKNSRLAVDFDLAENAIIIDSENGMIKATLEGQFAVLDEIFGKNLSFNKELNDGTGKK